MIDITSPNFSHIAGSSGVGFTPHVITVQAGEV
jgi:hypothetical protein